MKDLDEIRTLIAEGKLDVARDALKEIITSKPSAEAYYLASTIAINDAQKRLFLEKTLELDPFNAQAAEELEKLKLALLTTPTAPHQSKKGQTSIVNQLPPFVSELSSRILSFMKELFGMVQTIIKSGTAIQRLILLAIALFVLFILFWLPKGSSGNESEARAAANRLLSYHYAQTPSQFSEQPTISSIMQANNPNGIYGSSDVTVDEMWCVTFSPAKNQSYYPQVTNNMIVYRRGLQWYVYGGGSVESGYLDYAQTARSDFMAVGCTNWQTEGDLSDNN